MNYFVGSEEITPEAWNEDIHLSHDLNVWLYNFSEQSTEYINDNLSCWFHSLSLTFWGQVSNRDLFKRSWIWLAFLSMCVCVCVCAIAAPINDKTYLDYFLHYQANNVDDENDEIFEMNEWLKNCHNTQAQTRNKNFRNTWMKWERMHALNSRAELHGACIRMH